MLEFPNKLIKDNILFRKVPSYINCYCSDKGGVFLVNSNGIFNERTQFEWKTTKGTYLYVKVINDSFTIVNKAVHQLVCLAFHGTEPKDGFIYEPNHKDGNKHNNQPCNLEWVTRSTNVQEAYNNGLCTQGLRIEAFNILNKEVKKYNSLSYMAREWGIKRYILRDIINRHSTTPYMGEWIFSLDEQSDRKLRRHQSKAVVIKDIVNNKITVTSTIADASKITGVNSSTIALRLRTKNVTPFLNYMFSNVND